MNTTTINWCTLHKGRLSTGSSQMALTCTGSVHKAIENASQMSEVSFNSACATCGTVRTHTVTTTNQLNDHGILFLEPSVVHPIAEVDEECGDWQLYAGLLPGGRAFYRHSDGDLFQLYHPRARLPCGLISDTTNDSLEVLCRDQTPLLLFSMSARRWLPSFLPGTRPRVKVAVPFRWCLRLSGMGGDTAGHY
ncbi:hypothetical protein FN846DRAFT_910526 [Sphaerosporella brunnea]|uniref:Uncharacterized protein n=1 Tax=Sphaerosporella brunnea TaxID=1250544 RepID=A0A5J5ELP5_9PEZI|nr:hypothetical protein FN846DRAFT_910526 [Sphaerosporella brunnea]